MLTNPFQSIEQGQQARQFNAEQFARLPQPEYTEEQGLAARQEIMAAIQASELPLDKLKEIGAWAQRVIEQPDLFAKFQQWLRSQGLPDADIPQEPNIQELAGMVAVGNTAEAMLSEQGVSSEAELAPKPGAVAGPVSPEDLAATASAGRGRDTMLAHINPDEAKMLKSMGGMGTINPDTGLPEYGFFSDLWNGIKKVVKKVAPIILPAVAIFAPAVLPAIGGFVTGGLASGAVAGAVGAAVVSGGITAISGGSVKDVLKSAALTGLGSYLTPIVGKYAGSALGVTSQTLQSVLGSGIVAGGFAAARGGSVGQILTAAATGAAGTYLGQIAHEAINGTSTGIKVTNTKATQQAFEDAAFAAADAKSLADQGLSRSQITDILKTSGLSTSVASSAANAAVSGASAADIAVKLTNSAGTAKALYTDGQTGVQNSLIGGGNAEALTKVQNIEDARMIAADVKNLKALGLSNAAIQQNLEAAGVPSEVAKYAAGLSSSTTLETSLVTNYANKGTTLFTDAVTQGTTVRSVGAPPTADTNARLEDAQNIAADVKNLKAQGLSNSQIKATLIASGVDPTVATSASGQGNYSQEDIVKNLLNNSSISKITELYKPAAPVAPTAPAEVAPGAPTAPAQPVSDTGAGIGEIGFGPAAPTDIRSTGYSDSAPGTIVNGPNGQEVVLNSGKTVLLSDYNAAVDSGTPVSVDGAMQTQFRVELSGVPYTAGQSNIPADLAIPEGYRLATSAEAEAILNAGGKATTLPDGRMAWLTPTQTTPVAPEIVPGDGTIGGGGSPIAPPETVSPGPGGNPSQYVVDGNTVTIMPDGTQIIDYATGGTEMITPDGVRDFIPPTTLPTTPQPISEPVSIGGGATSQQFNNGSTQIVDAEGNTLTLLADGTQITDYANGQTIINYPDGTSDTVGGPTPTQPGGGGGGGTGTGTETGGQQPGTGYGNDSLEIFPVTPPTGEILPVQQPGTGFGDDSLEIFPVTPPTGGVLPGQQPGTGFGDDDTSVFPTTPPTGGALPGQQPGTGFGDDDTSVFPTTPPVIPPYVPTPIGPIIPPPTVPEGGYTLNWGTPDMPMTRFGLNPGLMEAVPQYQTTSPVQSQYYWGATPFQTGGPTGQVFDPNVARSSPYAPAVPFGLQQMFTPETSANVMQLLLAGQNPYASVIPLTRQG
jgi:hypothetical protein